MTNVEKQDAKMPSILQEQLMRLEKLNSKSECIALRMYNLSQRMQPIPEPKSECSNEKIKDQPTGLIDVLDILLGKYVANIEFQEGQMDRIEQII